LQLSSEQMSFPLRPKGGGENKERAEVVDSSQRVREHLVAYHLTPAITDLILTKIGNAATTNFNRHKHCCTVNGVKTQEIEPSRQNSTHHPLIVSNPIDKKASEFMHRNMRWHAP